MKVDIKDRKLFRMDWSFIEIEWIVMEQFLFVRKPTGAGLGYTVFSTQCSTFCQD